MAKATRRETLAGLGGLLAAMAVHPRVEGAFHVIQSGQAGQAGQPGPGAQFELADLVAELDKSKRPYHEFLRVKSLRAGLYRLAKGTEDRQSPHEQDEVYYVIEGRATFRVEDRVEPVKPGTVLFVRAKATHRFEAIEEDLTLLVLFSTADP